MSKLELEALQSVVQESQETVRLLEILQKGIQKVRILPLKQFSKSARAETAQLAIAAHG